MMNIWYLSGIATVMALVTAVFVIRAALVVVTVKGRSMSPTLRDGDQVLALRYWPSRWLRKGHLVLARASLVPASRSERSRGLPPTIKRIVGLPGDVIDNRSFKREREQANAQVSPLPSPPDTWHVPPGHVFVRGDNGSASLDSRAYGPLAFACVAGIVLMRFSRRDA